MNMQTTRRVFMLCLLLCVVLPACAEDSLCAWVWGGCLELTVTGQGTFDNLEIQLVDKNATNTPNGSSRIGTTFSSGDKLRVPAPAQETTARFSRLNVRARRGSEIVLGSTDISWPDGEHVPTTVKLRGACVDGWCRENPSDDGCGAIPSDERLTAVWASGPRDVWVVTGSGHVYRFDGICWEPHNPKLVPVVPVYGVFGSGPADLWIVGAGGTASHYDGRIWKQFPTGETQHLRSVWVGTDFTAWAVGNNGTILYFDGASWSKSPQSGIITTESLLNVRGTSSSNIWAVGSAEAILHYDGSAWTPIPLNSPKSTVSLWSIWLDPSGDGVIVGDEDTHIQLSRGQLADIDFGFSVGIGGAVWGSSSTNIWAAGCDLNIAHAYYSKWKQVRTSTLKHSQDTDCKQHITSIWGSSAIDIWAVGSSGYILKYGYWVE